MKKHQMYEPISNETANWPTQPQTKLWKEMTCQEARGKENGITLRREIC